MHNGSKGVINFKEKQAPRLRLVALLALLAPRRPHPRM